MPALRHSPLHRHASRDCELELREIDRLEARRIQQAVVEGVDAGHYGEAELGDSLDEGRYVARIGDEHVERAVLHPGETIRDERKDMVERQRGDEDFTTRLELSADPGRSLLEIGDHVAVTQHGAFGDAGRAAGVLQEREVPAAGRGGPQGLPCSFLEGTRERDRARQPERGHQLLHPPHHEIDQRRFREAESIPHADEDHVLNLGASDDLGEGVREVLDDDDGPRARVVELVFEFARGVERVGVDDGEAGEQHAEDRDRVGEQIRHHDRDAVARVEAEPLQVSGECPRPLVHLAVRDGDVEVRVGRPVGEAPHALLVQRHDRFVGVDVRLGRHSRRITPEPNLFHAASGCVSAQGPSHPQVR